MAGPKFVWSKKQEDNKQKLIELAGQKKKTDEAFRFIADNFSIKEIASMYGASGQSALSKAWGKRSKDSLVVEYIGWRARQLSSQTPESAPGRLKFFEEYNELNRALEHFAKGEGKAKASAASALKDCRMKLLLSGVPMKELEAKSNLVKEKSQELKNALAAFKELDSQILLRMSYMAEDRSALMVAQDYEKKKSLGRTSMEYLAHAYLEGIRKVLWEKRQLKQKANFTPEEVIRKIDFTTIPLGTFFVYLQESDPKGADRIMLYYRSARDQYKKIVRSIRKQGLQEFFDGSDGYWALHSMSYHYSSIDDAKRYSERLNQPAVSRHAEIGPMAERKPRMRRDMFVWRRPAYGTEILENPEPYRYFDPTVGTWEPKSTLDAIRSREPPDYSLVPIVGPVIDAMKKYDEIKTKNGLPSSVRTYDPEAKEWKQGEVRLLAGERGQYAEFTIKNLVTGQESTIVAKKPKGGWDDYPIPLKANKTYEKKFKVMKVHFISDDEKKDYVEFKTWNPYKKQEGGRYVGDWETRVEKKEGAKWTDYGLLTLYVTFAVLDTVFIAESVTRTGARSAGARTFIKGAEAEETYVRAMTSLGKEESVRLLNIARKKKSWSTVFRELKALAKGGEVTDDVVRSYIKKEWGGKVVRMAGRSKGSGFKDFFGKLLTPLSRKRYQARMVAEFCKEMRLTTEFSKMRELAQSLKAAGLSPAQERTAVEAIFHVMTSFSKKSQKALYEFIKGPGTWTRIKDKVKGMVSYIRKGKGAARQAHNEAEAWKKLLKNIEAARENQIASHVKERIALIKDKRKIPGLKGRMRMKKEMKLGIADETDAVLKGIAETIPQFRRALAYGPNYRLLEAAVYLYLLPRASQKPLELLMQHIENKMQVKVRDLERKELIFDLIEADRIMRSKPIRSE